MRTGDRASATVCLVTAAYPQRRDRDALEDMLEESNEIDYGPSERAQESEGVREKPMPGRTRWGVRVISC